MQKPRWQYIQNLYLILTLLSTLATSFIWGIDTLFLLSAGLTNAQVFLASGAFMIGQVLFEVPTGIVADLRGRRVSYLLGTLTLAVSTLLYVAAWYVQAPILVWLGAAALLGLGYTFFSGATEAWLVDALGHAGHTGDLDSVFAKGQSVAGAAMLIGSLGGGLIAQHTSLAVPYLARAAVLFLTFFVAFGWMKDWGFTPQKSVHLGKDIQTLFGTSLKLGLRNPSLRWVVLANPFLYGVGFYVFYAMQPHLLALYGNERAYGIAGLMAAIMAGTQIVGGMSVSPVRRLFARRTTVLLTTAFLGIVALTIISFTPHFWVALAMLVVSGLVSSIGQPVRRAYLNALIPTKQRATVLSFDSLVGSLGGAVIPPFLGRRADIGGYPASFLAGSVLQVFALPLLWLARRTKPVADKIQNDNTHAP